MSREPLEVGVFRCARIQRLYGADPAVHWPEELQLMKAMSADERPAMCCRPDCLPGT